MSTRALFATLSLLSLCVAPIATADVIMTEVSGSAMRDGAGQPIEVIHSSRGYFRSNGVELANTFGPGVAWIDVNADGWLDLIVANGSLTNDGLEPTGNWFFMNNGDGSFSDVSQDMRTYDSRVANGIAVGDMDNNGKMDIVFGNFWDEPQLFIGAGGNFFERAEEYLLNPLFYPAANPPPTIIPPETMGLGYGDDDSDGYLDLYVANYLKQRDLLFRNRGGGWFERTDLVDVTSEGYGFQSVFLDFDNDGDLDIYVTNDFGYNFLFENGGAASGYTFTEMARPYKCSGGLDESFPKSMGMGVAVADYDNDLDLDIYVSNYRLNALYRNDGFESILWRFREVAAAAGVETTPDFPNGFNCWGTDFADLDLDGDLDLLLNAGWIGSVVAAQPFELPNRLWLNNGAPNWDFSDHSTASGFDYNGRGRGLASADYDRDGDIDVAITNTTYHIPRPGPEATVYEEKMLLYRNDQDEGNHWSILKLEGGGVHEPGIGCNLSGIGGRVYLTAGGSTQMREVHGGGSYLSQNSLELEFGLGAATSIEEVRVRWICGAEEIFEGIEIDRHYRLIEGTGQGTALPVALSAFRVEPMTDGMRLFWSMAPGVELARTLIARSEGLDGVMVSLAIPVQRVEGGFVAFDDGVQDGARYGYQLTLISADGTRLQSPVVFATAGNGATPSARPVLGQNHPNPFNPSTSIHFDLPASMRVSVRLYDSSGRLVRTLLTGDAPSGPTTLRWDGRDDAGAAVASGVYTYTLETPRGGGARRMVLVR